MIDAGAVEVTLQHRAGCVVDVVVRSSRPIDAARVLVGRSVADGLRGVEALFPLCGAAHAAAAAAAVDDAAGRTPEPSVAARRRALVAGEAVLGHVFHFAVEWPRVLGRSPMPEAVQVARRAVTGLRAALGVDPAAVAAAAGAARELIEATVGRLPDDNARLPEWLAQHAPAARWSAALVARGAASFGRWPVRAPATPTAAWFATRLREDPGFVRRPSDGGAAAEVGALAAHRDDPRVAWVVARYGAGLLARLVARAVDANAVAAELEEVAAAAGPSRPIAVRGVTGGGAAVVRGARGLVAHTIGVADGVVTDWHVVAPTEWLLHRDGAVVHGLRGEATAQAVALAPALLTAVDPCVPFRIAAREATAPCAPEVGRA